MDKAAKPLPFMDVDGVLNPYAAAICPEGYRNYDFFPNEQPIRLAQVHGEWLRQLAVPFDIVWATGWGNDANRLIAPVLGLPRFPALIPSRRPFYPAEKVQHVVALAGHRILAWVDDDFADSALRWTADRRTPTLLIAVDPSIGLTERHVAQLRTWAADAPQNSK